MIQQYSVYDDVFGLSIVDVTHASLWQLLVCLWKRKKYTIIILFYFFFVCMGKFDRKVYMIDALVLKNEKTYYYCDAMN